MSKPKYTNREILRTLINNLDVGVLYKGQEMKDMLLFMLQETKEVKLKPKYISPEIEEMKRLSDEFFSKYLINSKQGEDK